MFNRIHLHSPFRSICLLVILVLSVTATSGQQRIDSTRLSEYEEVYVAPDTVAPAVTEEPDYQESPETEEGVKEIGEESTPPETFLDNSVPEGRSYKPRGMGEAYRASQKADPEYWYADYDFRPKEKKDPWWTDLRWLRWLNGDILQLILWAVIIGGFATVLIIYLRNNNVRLFRRTKKIDEEAGQEIADADLFAIDFDKQIARAVSAGNYRLATRMHFLQLLKLMADRNLVSYKHDSTNLDYLMQLASGPYYNDFFRLARTYEYAWYGEFEVDPGKYELIRRDFSDTLNRFGKP
ncbi:MAG: DUF4129 domain-containing protein [Chitinophagaceae bacterium]|nr:MAG: DUF4129 domain-containing protein [Chitinophagaceae bacterium]